MFARAAKTSNSASGPAAAPSGNNRAHPSADPKRAPLAKSIPNNTSINDFYRRPISGTSQASTFKLQPSFNPPKSRPTITSKPLQHRSLNAPYVATKAVHSNTGSLAALYGKSDSFTEEPSLAAARKVCGLTEATEEELRALGVCPDDFADDENLDLDIPCPLPLTKIHEAPAASGAGPKPSPPRPCQSPTLRAPQDDSAYYGAHVSSVSSKRASSDSTATTSPQPLTKRRKMPNWSKTLPQEAPLSSVMPAPKPLGAMLDATASAVKVQKKQLKGLSRKQTTAGLDNGGHAEAKSSRDRLSEVSSLPKPPGPLTLSNEQQHVKNLVCFKKASVFFTGPAGTGKSVLMRAIIDDLRTKYAKDPEQLGVTASTGLAACNIGGMTLHSFAGIGLGKEDPNTLIRKIRQNQKARNRWLKTKTLVIDEISMLDGDLFDKLSQIGRTIRKNGRPWGGIQLVLTGDFFQLPPVPDREKRDVKFAFEALTWGDSIDHTIGLTEVFRQKDPEFAQMLNEMRLGQISEQTVQTFKSLSRPLQFDDGLEVTELFPTRQEVENSNERRLRGLNQKSMFYEALDTGEPALREKLLQNMMAPKMLELRVGAQVMLIKNMDESLVNGSLGTVEKFMTESEYIDLNASSVPADPDIKKRTSILNSYLNGDTLTNNGNGGAGNSGRLYPYVLFHGIGGSTRGILIRPEEWKSELPNGVVQASRTQLPLILAWALSIHKAQGQTLERVKVDLGRVFEKGQAYVALSRATTKSGLQVLRFEKHKVMAHPKVIGFYGKLSSAEAALKGKHGNASILAFTNPLLKHKTATAAYGTG
ncbi:ATP-dependent DNA helicase PIF1 [Sporothrix schenckii 1099-18]|uniref:ATP-dependent DNA helicase PIF1 n=1 Tax=Sporothrix schenckii 1099-18 TaxID=1397361 RepID=A0A0F2MNY3_SPOSC|nr:ATP-dependent DNA helicase PIF1 [Sporothrix schenckii 1099-18]KJR89896.1 ATP-dependent DNA helicase PIF1 [Sporothrix schenckii 1099-18]